MGTAIEMQWNCERGYQMHQPNIHKCAPLKQRLPRNKCDLEIYEIWLTSVDI